MGGKSMPGTGTTGMEVRDATVEDPAVEEVAGDDSLVDELISDSSGFL